MDTKTLIKALKIAVREVIKEELVEILQEGLQSTVNEMKRPVVHEQRAVSPTRKPATKFKETQWASILNETDPLVEQSPVVMNSFADMMNESYDETISMTSRDAQGFGMMRQNMKQHAPVPQTMEDPETGKVYDIAPEVAQAMTRDYSALMKAINAKKGM